MTTTEKRTLIALHDTVATYEGTKTRPCMFKTALCPNQCGHARENASFKIKSYKTPVENQDTAVGFETAKTAAEHLATIKGLKEGDEVDLQWKHEKVEKDFGNGTSSSGGERTIHMLAKAGGSDGLSEISRENLSSHETISELESVAFRKCMHMTSMCPEQCGHGGNVATFKVLGYINYHKPGQYGDEQQQHFHVKLEGNGAEKDAEVIATIKSLKPNDKVRLDWDHDYVTNQGSKFPERPVKNIQKISEEHATEMLSRSTD